VSVTSFDTTTTTQNATAKTTIVDSSIGYNSLVCAGATVSKSVVPPLSTITTTEPPFKMELDETVVVDVDPEKSAPAISIVPDESLLDVELGDTLGDTVDLSDASQPGVVPNQEDPRPLKQPTSWDIFRVKMATEFWYLVWIVILWVAMMPAFEVWNYFDAPSVEVAAVVLALCSVVQSIAWTFVLLLIQQTQACLGTDGTPLVPLYIVYLTLSWSVQYWTLLPTLWGSNWFNGVATMLGTRFEGRALYFGQCIHDFNQQTIAHGTIVDGAVVCGHSFVYGDVSYGPNRLSGVYREKVFQTLFVGTNPSSQHDQVGPWKAVVGSGQH